MKHTLILKAMNSENLVALKKAMEKVLQEATPYLKQLQQEQKKIVYDKITHLNKWYTKLIGLDEVKVYQERVTALQDQLLTTQNKRRELTTQLNEIRKRAQEIQSQIQHIDRKEKFDVYCVLINDEREILNMERSVTSTFQEYDSAERDLFTAYTNAVRDSQERQRSQIEYSKYLGLFFSLIGSCLAFMYTLFWKNDLKLYIRNQINTIPGVTKSNQNIEQTFSVLQKNLQTTIVNTVRQEIAKYGNENQNPFFKFNRTLPEETKPTLEDNSIRVSAIVIGVGLVASFIILRAIMG